MAKKTFMRVDQDLLNKLKAKKIAQRESYADVVARMIDNEVRLKPLHKSEYAKKQFNEKLSAQSQRLADIDKVLEGF